MTERKWEIIFNVDKHKVVNMKSNPTFTYIVMGSELAFSPQDRILGMTDTSMKTLIHCSVEIKKRRKEILGSL